MGTADPLGMVASCGSTVGNPLVNGHWMRAAGRLDPAITGRTASPPNFPASRRSASRKLARRTMPASGNGRHVASAHRGILVKLSMIDRNDVSISRRKV